MEKGQNFEVLSDFSSFLQLNSQIKGSNSAEKVRVIRSR